MPRLTRDVPVPMVGDASSALVTAPVYGRLWTVECVSLTSLLACNHLLTQNGEVFEMDWTGLAGLAAIWATLVTSHALLRRELKADIREVRDDVRRLDDRMYQLATGLKPLVEQAERSQTS